MRHSLYPLLFILLCTAAQAQRHIFLASSPATYPMENNQFYSEPDTTFYIFLAFGQSNMVGDAKPEDCDYEGVSKRFQMMAAVSQTANAGNNRGAAREQYQWYTATPPLNNGYSGLSPCDYFGRTLVEGLPKHISVGIINVANIYGAGAVQRRKSIDMEVHLEMWQDGKEYDRLGLTENYTEILGVKIPSLLLPIHPGRNLAVVLEVAARNLRQKQMGYNAAIELAKRSAEIAQRDMAEDDDFNEENE